MYDIIAVIFMGLGEAKRWGGGVILYGGKLQRGKHFGEMTSLDTTNAQTKCSK